MLRNVCQSFCSTVCHVSLCHTLAECCFVVSFFFLFFLQLVFKVLCQYEVMLMFHEGFWHLHRFYRNHHLGFLKGYKNRLCILHKQLKSTSASAFRQRIGGQMNSPYFLVPSCPLKSMRGKLDWKAEGEGGV